MRRFDRMTSGRNTEAREPLDRVRAGHVVLHEQVRDSVAESFFVVHDQAAGRS